MTSEPACVPDALLTAGVPPKSEARFCKNESRVGAPAELLPDGFSALTRA